MTGGFEVLMVCTGNICRSPMAELLLRQGLADRPGAPAEGIVVASAGTRGLAGRPMEWEAASALSSHGVDGAGFRARALGREQVAAADLVLTATREHRSAVVVLQPRAATRTFTLLEFARLCAQVPSGSLPTGDPVERALALVRVAVAQRGSAPPTSPADDDVVDPYGGPLSGFLACAELEDAALQGPLDLLFGPSSGRVRRPRDDS